jgi:hypothetical protein
VRACIITACNTAASTASICLYRRSPAAGPDYQEADVRFIDLEKLRLGLSRERVGAHDLDQLMRHTQGWSDDDRACFLSAYRQQRAALKG